MDPCRDAAMPRQQEIIYRIDVILVLYNILMFESRGALVILS